MADNTQFTIPKDGYLNFSASSLKQFIKDRLNETGVFSDQNYEGSYISTINEIIAYVFQNLMYNLNRTSTESLFSEAQIYENMNRIVKLLDYKPVGKQTSTLTFALTAGSQLGIGLYTVPRYAYIENGQASYSFNEDITFSKTVDVNTTESLDSVAQEKLLYQGRYREYPIYTAAGNENEVIYFAPGDNVLVDHFNVDVYVYQNNTWKQWNRVTSLYLEDAFSESYEIRLNESKRYEIKFGNGINGKKLESDDQVAIYYLESNGSAGEIGVHAIQGKVVVPFSTTTLDQILEDIRTASGESYTYLDTAQLRYLQFDNNGISTYYQQEESVDDIRNNAPGIFRSQYRLITETDYENYIKTNFANLIHDVKAVNNWKYLSEQLKYYHDIGLNDPNNVSNILFNQVHFADGCNFNNVYVTVIPKVVSDTTNPTANLTPAQKELMISSIEAVKTLTSETIILDPVYIAVGLGIAQNGGISGKLADLSKTELLVVKVPSSRRDNNSIKTDVNTVFANYFDRSNLKLGDELDVTYLVNSILSIDGVKTFYTRRTDNTSIAYNGLSLIVWNPIYPTDLSLTTKNLSMSYFKYLYLNDKDNFSNFINVQTEAKVYETIEY